MRTRKEHEDVLVPTLRAALAKRSAVEWEQLFQSRVPCTVVRPIEDMFDHPQVLAEELIAEHPHPTLGSYRTFTGPVRFAGGRFNSPDRRAPLLGEHTVEVLQEVGMTGAEIAAVQRV
jgi:formyl-CoA transferase